MNHTLGGLYKIQNLGKFFFNYHLRVKLQKVLFNIKNIETSVE